MSVAALGEELSLFVLNATVFAKDDLSQLSFGTGPVSFHALLEKIRCFNVRGTTSISCILYSLNSLDIIAEHFKLIPTIPRGPCLSS